VGVGCAGCGRTVACRGRVYKPLPLEAWTSGLGAGRWALVGRWEKDAPVGPANFFLSAAVDEDDNVLLLDVRNQAWSCRFDVSKADEAGGKKEWGKEGARGCGAREADPAGGGGGGAAVVPEAERM